MGTKDGGLKASEQNKKRYGKDFYKKIGAKGGKAPTILKTEEGKSLKGFALNRERAKLAGKKGGQAGKGVPKNGSRKTHNNSALQD